VALAFRRFRLRRWRACRALPLAVLASLALAASAQAAPDRSFTLTPGTAAEWDGPVQPAANGNYDSASGTPCGKDPDTYCDTTLLNVGERDAAFYSSHRSTLTVEAKDFTVPANDFDVYVYKSDASGSRGTLAGSDGAPPGVEESVTINNPSGYYLVQVVYFATTGGYHGSALVTDTEAPPLVNQDVDTPPGVQEALASNPALGFRSHSEPHIAQSPTNPNILVAGSKQYNRDPDSLKEYEFKIGTYVSFDRGRTWSDLGQIDLCPSASDAPPESWPDNTCYPADDPNVSGTGPEDEKDNRGRSDYGEEYLVSDVWIQFDDEGNAYTMVLDSAPFADSAGWAMSFHKWETPSPEDVASGNTWGKKVVINNYPQEKGNTGAEDNGSNPAAFLDDKNTFAINNAGPDGDGKTGTILACWGQNISTAIKQQTVCERSTDAGKSFPDQPRPVSGEQQLVLGVATLADRDDPNTFYVIWKSYTTAVAGGIVFPTLSGDENDDLGIGIGTRPTLLYEAMSADGGQTFTPAEPIAHYDELASPLPGSTFRTGAIPIANQAPNGDIYVVFDAYNDAPDPAHDADGKTADAMIIKSTDHGVSWSGPQKVNGDTGNADQFQSHVAIGPRGDVNVAYFDTRLDPQNHFVDEWLSRSTDEGATFKDTRMSHDSSDAEINPPTDGNGNHFFGDYQGMVADRCQSLAFYQDTHLANDPARDPEFDQGMPRSQFQEVFAYRVPVAGASGDPGCEPPPSSAVAAPFVNPAGEPCTPSPPRSSISRNSIRTRRRGFRAAGRSVDRACREKDTPGTVKRVQIAIGKKVGRKCRFYKGRGHFGAKRPCSKRKYVRARLGKRRAGKVPWTFRARRGFGRPARYRLTVRGIDSNGLVERLLRRYNQKLVRVRRARR
jgi:hypothetical protein